MSRRRFLQLMGMSGAAVLLGSCGGEEEVAQTTAAAGTSATTAAPTTAAPVEIDFWLPGGSDPFCQGFELVADAFAAEGSGISVREVLCGVADDEDFNER
ncbi:MAG: twin-arginine translocation signal domain-containing protein, partial [bacterium]|nr:twin-arginine translocation signal domain-containing protein [bacterium]